MNAAGRTTPNNSFWYRLASAILPLLVVGSISAFVQDEAFHIDPSQSSVKFTLSDVLHTIHGEFHLKPGELLFDPAAGRISGQIVVDARSGESGNGMRDRKMHKEILDSERYPEISFRADQVNGVVADQGKSSVMVHGTFNIHGVDREITVPAAVELDGDHWTAAVHFTIPYVKWGMKNPSTLFLRVNDSVEIDLVVAGSVVRHASNSVQ